MKRMITILSIAVLLALSVGASLTAGDYNQCVNYCYKAYAGNDAAIKACISRCR